MSNPFLISASHLAESLTDPNLVILDCRGTMNGPEAGTLLYRESHIPGARKIEFSTQVKGKVTDETGRTPLPDREEFQATLQALGIDENSHVVIYDDGRFQLAPRTWFTLRWMGLTCVSVLDGGFRHWLECGYPVTTQIPQFEHSQFKARAPLDRIFLTEDIEENLRTGNYRLIDARGYGAYSGENPGPDPVGGHIPGSVSRPNSENLDVNGLLIGLHLIREEFLELAHGDDSRIIHTCGSGVAACGNYLACKAAGLNPAGIYIGSFSQWIRNPLRPVSTEDEALTR